MKIGFITLGCDKNTVDSERYLAQLAEYGGEYTDHLDLADVIIVNTCGFIDAAKKESIDALVEAGQYKAEGSCRAVVAIGCMVERHKGELTEALPEVDLFLGNSETDTLISELADRGLLDDQKLLEHPGVRLYTGDVPHIRYLKISEGCDHGCAFCAIPLMRGKHRSFALNDIVREAQLLELQGAREVNLVAQDLAHYGRDLRNAQGVSTIRLPDLLEALVRETNIPWIRMMYLYSAGITPRLLEVVAREPRILPYLDMPIQHASNQVLERMRRPERQQTIREKVSLFRKAVPDVAIRTTCIVGFPGETSSDFEQLCEFLEEVQFERVGFFAYSPQEGTRAQQMHDDVPVHVKEERLEHVSDLQRAITAERYEARLGRTWTALVDSTDPETNLSLARLPWQADDIDGVTFLDDNLPPGTLVEVAVHEVIDDYDFRASIIRVVDTPPQPSASDRAATNGRRELPMLSTSISSFGK
jgi:ribosomal protein S12 methylthiotransferase